MNKQELQRRWHDPAFVNAQSEIINNVFESKNFSQYADLKGLTVGLSGVIASLISGNLHEAKILEVDFSFGNFSCSFGHSIFTNIRFNNSEFDTCRMSKSQFANCSFIHSQLIAPSFDDTNFNNCNFEHCLIRGRGFKGYGGKRTVFECCNFKNAIFQGIELRACKFVNCAFEEITLRKSILSGVSFTGGTPLSTNFHACELLQCTQDGKTM